MSFKHPRLRFGKYDGERIRDVPSDYLKWLDSLPDLFSRTRRAVRAELKEREEEATARAAQVRQLNALAKARKAKLLREEDGPQ